MRILSILYVIPLWNSVELCGTLCNKKELTQRDTEKKTQRLLRKSKEKLYYFQYQTEKVKFADN